VFGCLLCLAAWSARAAASDASSAETSQEARVAPGRHAVIFVIGIAAESEELRAGLSDLLGSHGISYELSSAVRFDPDALMAQSGEDRHVLVFVKLERERARLYFRGPGGARFLLRRLALPKGLDEVGSELVAQVLESSVLALLHSSAGLSRAQASAELAREAAAPPVANAPPKPPRSSAPTRPLRCELGARYGVGWSGAELGLGHGPGAELGLRFGAPWFVRAALVAERWFEQSLRARGIEADVQATAARAGVALGIALGPRHALAGGLSAGVDVRRVTPRRTTFSSIRLAETDTRAVPLLRAELRYELVSSPLRFAAGPFLDWSLVDTHFDLLEAGRRVRVVEPWPVRPGVFAALGLEL
jgi:hypothetical protein